MDRIATICANGSFLAQRLTDPEDIMARNATHGVYGSDDDKVRVRNSPRAGEESQGSVAGELFPLPLVGEGGRRPGEGLHD